MRIAVAVRCAVPIVSLLLVGVQVEAQTTDATHPTSVSVRLHTGAGATSSSGELGDGTSAFASTRILLANGPRRRFGVELAYIEALSDRDVDLAYGAVGIVLEQDLGQRFFISIGSLGYFGLGDNEDNPFGVVSMAAWTPSGDRFFIGIRNDVIFDEPSTRISSIVLGGRF